MWRFCLHGSCACVLSAHAAPSTHGISHGSPSWHQTVHTPELLFKVTPCALITLLTCQSYDAQDAFVFIKGR